MVAVTLASSVVVGACEPDRVVGDVLTALETQTRATIEAAGSSSDGLLLTAASAVELDVDATVSILGADLPMRVTQIDATARAELHQLEILVDSLGSRAARVLTATADDAAALVHRLGNTGSAPVVTSYSPRFTTLVLSAAGLTLHLRGIFPHADEAAYAATLVINGRVQPTSALTSSNPTGLTFRLAPGTFTVDHRGFTPPSIEVMIPYARGKVFKRILPGTFHPEVATIPDWPAKSLG